MAFLQFNAAEVQPADDFSPIPPGEYRAEITESSIDPTKNGTGEMLKLTFRVLDGQYAGRLLWDRLNIRNQNPIAQEIALRTLSSICHAVGRINVQDSAQLHGIPVFVKVAIKADAGYEPSNQIKAYKSAGAVAVPGASTPAHASHGQGSAAPGKPSFATNAAPTSQPANVSRSDTPPWQRAAS